MGARNLNLHLDTLYSAFEMIASGITTVQHIHGWMPGTLAEAETRADDLIVTTARRIFACGRAWPR